MVKKLTLLLFAVCFASQLDAQTIAVKSNLLYGAATFTPNLGAELAVDRNLTIDLSGGYNPWNLDGDQRNNKKLVHWVAQAEMRYWLCESFHDHFFGVHLLGSQYNISGRNLPLLFEKGSKDFRYEGYAMGGGISYGYHLMLSKHFGVEFNVGLGVAYMEYDKYDCAKCGTKLGDFNKVYVGPTRAGISLVYIIK